MLRRLPAPPTVLLLATCGGSIATVILLYDSQATPQSAAYTHLAEFTVWLFINFLMYAITAILSPMLWNYIWRRRSFLVRQYKLILSLIYLLALLFVPDYYAQIAHFGRLDLPLTHQREKAALLVAASFILVSIPAVLAIWLVRADADAMLSRKEITETDILSYLQLRDQLSTLALTIGTYTGIAVLASAALRSSLIAAKATSEVEFPTILSLVYGAYFSFILFLAYLPSYFILNLLGRYIRDYFFALPKPNSKNWKETIDKRFAIENLLQLKTTDQQNIIGNLALLTPIISGIVSILLKT